MKKLALFSLGILAFALVSVHAQNTIMYTTFDDWTNWNGDGDGCTAVSTFDYDGVLLNGIGNQTAPTAVTGPGGSLQLNPAGNNSTGTGWNVDVYGPGLTAAEVIALDGPEAVPPYSAASGYGPGSMVAQSGKLLMDFVMPDNNTLSTFSTGIWFQDNNTWTVWGASSYTDLGPVTTPNGTQEMYEAVIPYNISACASVTFAQIGIWQGGAAVGQYPWYVDSLSVVPIVTPSPGTPLFTTYDDFNQWYAVGSPLVQGDNTWSVSDDDTNGLGNTNAPGTIGTSAGSLELYWSSVLSSWGIIASGPDEQGNPDFMQAIDPGCNIYTTASVPAYGNLYVDFSQPDNSGGGNYFQFGINFSYGGNGYNVYGAFFPTSTQDQGYKDDNNYEVYQATIPYTINAGNYYGFTPSIWINSNYSPTNAFHIDNITVSASQAPQITSETLNGNQLTLLGTGGLAGDAFNVLSTTSLAPPVSWTTISHGNVFVGPNWTNTITINPASPAAYYEIQVQSGNYY